MIPYTDLLAGICEISEQTLDILKDHAGDSYYKGVLRTKLEFGVRDPVPAPNLKNRG